MVSQGAKPAVISGLMKYQCTERMRACLNAAFDIHGGKAICDGPSNYLQAAYQISPVSITVEGANILTRSLIVFAQKARRSHPYLYAEIEATQNADREAGFLAFEKAFETHVAFAASNIFLAHLPQRHLRPVRQRAAERSLAALLPTGVSRRDQLRADGRSFGGAAGRRARPKQRTTARWPTRSPVTSSAAC